MSTLKSQERHGSRLVKKNSSSRATTAPVKCLTCTTSRPTDQKDQVSCLTTGKSTILETNHNVNAVTNTNTPNASFRLSSKVNTSSKIIKKDFHCNSSTFIF